MRGRIESKRNRTDERKKHKMGKEEAAKKNEVEISKNRKKLIINKQTNEMFVIDKKEIVK